MKKIDRVNKRFVEEGIEVALTGHDSSLVYEYKTDGDFEAHWVALSCRQAPDGYARWNLRSLADKGVELNYVDSISHETIRSLKNEIKSWQKEGWAIPPQEHAEFVASMEQVLDVYKRLYEAENPVVYMDESPNTNLQSLIV